MIDFSLFTDKGGRGNNEDYVSYGKKGNALCFVLCDGLGGHDCGEVASESVAGTVVKLFEEKGNYNDFLDDAFVKAQTSLLNLQREKGMVNAMKSTMVVLVIDEEQMKWAHIGDSRLYHIFADNTKYERTKDHSMIQILLDMGEITEKEMRHHPDRNKVLRVMGAEWSTKSYDKSAILERDGKHAFVLMTDGFWEYVQEEEMLDLLGKANSAKAWLDSMRELVEARADMTSTDNYSAICVIVE